MVEPLSSTKAATETVLGGSIRRGFQAFAEKVGTLKDMGVGGRALWKTLTLELRSRDEEGHLRRGAAADSSI